MSEDKELLKEFADLADNMKRLFRISVLKQNKVIQQFIDRVCQLNDGFMINDTAVAALHDVIPKQLRFSAQEGLNAREKSLCRKLFFDQMDMLDYRVKHGWDSIGGYPYGDYQAMISASERMLATIESTDFHLEHLHSSLVDVCASKLNNKIEILVDEVCEFYDYDPEYVEGVLLIHKCLFFYALQGGWNQTSLLHGWGLGRPSEGSIATRLASKSKARSMRGANGAKHVAVVKEQEQPDQNGEVEDSEALNALSLHLCAVEDVEKTLSNSKKIKPADKKHLEKLRDNKGYVSQAPIPASYRDILRRFRVRFPHMCPLADEMEANLSLLSMGGTGMPLNLLAQICILDGPPGVGKTVAVSFLAKEFELTFRVIGCAGLSNGFDITGHSSGWSTGKPGYVAEMLIEQKSPNGIIILDEVDKMNGSDTSPVSNALYSLLEPTSAKHFRDEFYDFEMDASRINWLATSNSYENIPAPIRDRAKRIVIQMPDTEQRKTIASYLYHDDRLEHEQIWGKYFAPELPDDVAAFIAEEKSISIRGMKQVIHGCFRSPPMPSNGDSEWPLQSITVSKYDAEESLQIYMKENGHTAIQQAAYQQTRIGFIQSVSEVEI